MAEDRTPAAAPSHRSTEILAGDTTATAARSAGPVASGGQASQWMVLVYTAGVLLLVVAGRNVFVSAATVLGWAIASVVAAVLLTPLVQFLDRFLPRALAFVSVFLGVAAAGLAVRFAYVSQIDGQVDYLADRGPRIAAAIEAREDRVGDIARELGLVDRVTELLERLQDQVGNTSDALRDAAMAAPAYLVSFILTIFFLVFGPEMVRAGLDRFGGDRRDRLSDAVHGAARAVQVQVGAAVLVAAAVGGTVWVVADHLDAPSAGLFALAAAAASAIPYVGILVGWLPVIIVGFGVASIWEVIGVAALAFGLQYVEATRWRPFVDRRSLYVGPAVILIAGALGYAVYGVGGLFVLIVVAVFALAVADQVATDDDGSTPAADADALDPIPTPIDEYVAPDPADETDADQTDADQTDDDETDDAASNER